MPPLLTRTSKNTYIEGISRPQADLKMIIKCINDVKECLRIPPDIIAESYFRGASGEEIASTLKTCHFYEVTSSELKLLAKLDELVDRAEEKAVRDWHRSFNPQQKFKIGETIEQGVITEISKDHLATYLVLNRDHLGNICINKVFFEDATPPKTDKAHPALTNQTLGLEYGKRNSFR